MGVFDDGLETGLQRNDGAVTCGPVTAAARSRVGNPHPCAKQDHSHQVGQKCPSQPFEGSTPHGSRVSIGRAPKARNEGRDSGIYRVDRNYLLPPLWPDRYIGLDTEQDYSFESALTGIELLGVAVPAVLEVWAHSVSARSF